MSFSRPLVKSRTLSLCLGLTDDRRRQSSFLLWSSFVFRHYTLSPARSNSNFLSKLVENIRQEYKRNKELKASVEKFYEQTKKLDQSEPLQKAREKYKKIEDEGSAVLKQRIGEFKDKLHQTAEQVGKTRIVESGKQFGETVSKAAGQATETLGKAGKDLGISDAVSKGIKAAKEGLDSDTVMSHHRLYKAPEKLRRRRDRQNITKTVEKNEDATEMVMHKDSRWRQEWNSFRENNPLYVKYMDLRTKYEESDHLAVRITRAFTERIGSAFTGTFGGTELSDALTAITSVDPSFDKEEFVNECRTEIIPTILEALTRGDMEVLEDWCSEAAFSQLTYPLKEAKKLNYTFNNKIIDITDVDIPIGKIMDAGPILVVTFNAQQVFAVRDANGAVVEGNPDEVMRVRHAWVLVHDQDTINRDEAWKVMEVSFTSEKQAF